MHAWGSALVKGALITELALLHRRDFFFLSLLLLYNPSWCDLSLALLCCVKTKGLRQKQRGEKIIRRDLQEIHHARLQLRSFPEAIQWCDDEAGVKFVDKLKLKKGMDVRYFSSRWGQLVEIMSQTCVTQKQKKHCPDSDKAACFAASFSSSFNFCITSKWLRLRAEEDLARKS